MRKLGFLALFFVVLTMVSCETETKRIDSRVTFSMDGQEITADTITVPLNSYQEIIIKTVAPSESQTYNFYWQYATGYPIELANGSDNFQIVHETVRYGSNGYEKMTAEFRMIFSDTTYHSGDVCRLRVTNSEYQKVLKVRVE